MPPDTHHKNNTPFPNPNSLCTEENLESGEYSHFMSWEQQSPNHLSFLEIRESVRGIHVSVCLFRHLLVGAEPSLHAAATFGLRKSSPCQWLNSNYPLVLIPIHTTRISHLLPSPPGSNGLTTLFCLTPSPPPPPQRIHEHLPFQAMDCCLPRSCPGEAHLPSLKGTPPNLSRS